MGRILTPGEVFSTETREDVLLKRARLHQENTKSELEDASVMAAKQESKLSVLRDVGASPDALKAVQTNFEKSNPLAASIYKTRQFKQEMERGALAQQYISTFYNMARSGNKEFAIDMWNQPEAQELQKKLGLSGMVLEDIKPEYLQYGSVVPKNVSFKTTNALTGKTESITGDGVTEYAIAMDPNSDTIVFAIPRGPSAQVLASQGAGGNNPALDAAKFRAEESFRNYSKLVTDPEQKMIAENLLTGGNPGIFGYKKLNPTAQTAVMDMLRYQHELNQMSGILAPPKKVRINAEDFERLAKEHGFTGSQQGKDDDLERFLSYWLYTKNTWLVPEAADSKLEAADSKPDTAGKKYDFNIQAH